MSHRTLCLLLIARVAALAEPAATITKGLNVSVLQGDGVIHDLPNPSESRVSIRVSDANGTPIRKATTVFEFPEIGPSAAVASDGSPVKVVLTDNEGAATVSVRSNGVPGHFQPRVTVNYLGQTATVTLKQENAFAPGVRPDVYRHYAAKAIDKPRRSKKWVYILGIAGGAAAGALVAMRGGAVPPAPPPQQPPQGGGGITITPGTGTVGGRP